MGLRTWLGLKKPRVPKTAPVWRVPITDYETYRRTQNAGNAAKIDWVWAKQPNITRLADFIGKRCGTSPNILCHGTRNGAEQRFFKAALPHASVLGTDIADTATQFPDTIQWDFHELKAEWIGRFDAIYSNSWDHAFDPERAFANWLRCLSANGVLLIEHTREHTPKFATELDPFGATLKALIELLQAIPEPRCEVVEVLTDLPDRTHDDCVVVVRVIPPPS